MTFIRSLVLAIPLVILFSGCGEKPIDFIPKQAQSSTGKIVCSDPEIGYEISFPDSWTVNKKPPSPSVVNATGARQAGVNQPVYINIMRTSSAGSLTASVERGLAAFNAQNVKIVNKVPLRLGNLDSFKVEIERDEKNKRTYRMNAYFIESGDHSFQINAVVQKDDYPKCVAEIEEIVNSFKLIVVDHKIFTRCDFGFQIEYPSSWTVTENLPNAVAISGESNLAPGAIERALIYIAAIPLEIGSDLNIETERFVTSFGRGRDSINLISVAHSPIKFKEIDAQKFTIISRIDAKGKVSIFQNDMYLLISQGQRLAITVQILQSELDKYESLTKSVLKTFTIVPVGLPVGPKQE